MLKVEKEKKFYLLIFCVNIEWWGFKWLLKELKVELLLRVKFDVYRKEICLMELKLKISRSCVIKYSGRKRKDRKIRVSLM